MTPADGTAPRFVAAVPALPVSDEARAVAFFVDVLGFEALTDDDGNPLGIVRRDAVEVHVWVADGSARGAERHLAGSASCRLQVEAVEVLARRCEAAGVVHPAAPLRSTPWGTRELGTLDPDGNLVTLFEPVPAGRPAGR